METWNDPIVAEVRAAREAYAEEMHYDLAAICADLRRRQHRHQRPNPSARYPCIRL